MPRRQFTIGTPGNQSSTELIWRINVLGEPVPGAFLATEATVYLGTLIIRHIGANFTDIVFSLDSSDSGVGDSTRQDLTAALEQSITAFTIQAGGLSLVIPGPDAAGTEVMDDTEPYNYQLDDTAALSSFVSSYFNLTNAQKAATTFTIDDGVSVRELFAADDFRATESGAALNTGLPITALLGADDFRATESGAALNIMAPQRPEAPALPVLTVIGETEIRVAYVEPNDNGAAISGYVLEYKRQVDTDWIQVILGPTILSATVENLTPDTDYEFRVAAINIAGTGDFSDIASAMTHPPNRMPTLEDIEDQTVDGGITVTLTAVASDPDGHALSYLWQRISGPNVVIANANQSTATFPAPLQNTPSIFVFRVTVTDSQGASVSGDVRVTVNAAPLIPDRPAAPTLASVGATRLRVNWLRPNHNNSDLTSFALRYRVNGTADWITIENLGVEDLLYYIEGLLPDTEYDVEIQATNGIGPSLWSPTATQRTGLPEAGTAKLVHWLANFVDSGYRFWSGDGNLTIGGVTYQGRNFISLSTAEASLDAPRRRMTASFTIFDSTLRRALLQDPGPLTVEIRWIYSIDNGVNWLMVPRRFVGRLSTPVIRDGRYTIEIETYGGDVDRGRPLKWSHEDQMRRFPGDRGLEYMRAISEGVEISWPP